MKLTAATVAKLALPADRAEQIFWDEDIPGFGLRLRTGGRGRWIFQYRIGRRQRRTTIGVASAISPADARATATKLYARPGSARTQQRNGRKQSPIKRTPSKGRRTYTLSAGERVFARAASSKSVVT